MSGLNFNNDGDFLRDMSLYFPPQQQDDEPSKDDISHDISRLEEEGGIVLDEQVDTDIQQQDSNCIDELNAQLIYELWSVALQIEAAVNRLAKCGQVSEATLMLLGIGLAALSSGGRIAQDELGVPFSVEQLEYAHKAMKDSLARLS